MSDLVDVLAVHRLTRLVTVDDLTAPRRNAAIAWAYREARRVPDDPVEDWTDYAQADEAAPPLARLLTCRWCTSVWVGFGVVLVRRLAPRLWRPAAAVLALSSASTFLARLED